MLSKLTKPVGLTPINDRIIVRRIKEREKTKGGILLADVGKEKPYYGVVIGSGEAVRNPHLSRGNVIVMFGKYAGTEVDVDGETVLTMREEEVSGIVSNVALVEDLVAYGA